MYKYRQTFSSSSALLTSEFVLELECESACYHKLSVFLRLRLLLVCLYLCIMYRRNYRGSMKK